MIVASTIVPPAFAGAGFAASAGRAPLERFSHQFGNG
jgi:hypothetical protein